MTIDEVIRKWIQVRNQLHIDRQDRISIEYAMNAGGEGDKYKYEDVPFPNPKTAIKEHEKFDRVKAWEEAPEMDLNKLRLSLR